MRRNEIFEALHASAKMNVSHLYFHPRKHSKWQSEEEEDELPSVTTILGFLIVPTFFLFSRFLFSALYCFYFICILEVINMRVDRWEHHWHSPCFFG